MVSEASRRSCAMENGRKRRTQLTSNETMKPAAIDNSAIVER